MMNNANEIQVSIICTAYNHEKYIRQCLDGFVMQKGVTFEVIIHDDASTDSTADIIREYEKKYPGIFKPIYQTENQHSQHIPFTKKYIIPIITGKYVALCEGDDYWTDEYKLKKQYDALEVNPDCYICLHKANVVGEDGNPLGYTCPRKDILTSILPTGYICLNYDNAKYIHTSSFFMNADKYKELTINPPKFKKIAPVGDIPTLLYFTFIGNAYYINEIMSNYRFMSIGSWSYRNQNDADREERVRNIQRKMKDMMVEFCLYTENKYYSNLISCINDWNMNEYWYCIMHKDYKSLFKEFSRKELLSFGLSRKAILKMKLHIIFPKLF